MTERAVPFYCPYCGDEDLEPYEKDGGWHCRACTRAFSLRFIGTGALMSGRASSGLSSAGSGAAGATREGSGSKRPLTARAELARSTRASSGEGAR